MSSQRDVFIDRLFERALEDKNICLISVDMGAPSLDRWRSDLPEQFIAAGISEQNAINYAAGLSAAGKKVYVYFMAAWVARCFEQIRYSCAMGNNPITILGNGVALGYAPAGPAHEPNEDMAYMRSICGIEIHSPANTKITKSLVDLTCDYPKLRYIRLERSYPSVLNELYNSQKHSKEFLEMGMFPVFSGLADPPRMTCSKPKICILSSGYMLGRAHEVYKKLIEDGYETTVVDMWRLKPINSEVFVRTIDNYDVLVTLEEQQLFGGFGSAICEQLADTNNTKSTLRIGLPEKYIFDNGSREHLLNTNGLSVADIHTKITNFLHTLKHLNLEYKGTN